MRRPRVLVNGEEPNDYVFPPNPDYPSVWITVDNLSVYVVRTDEGVVVDIFGHGKEMDGPLGSTYAYRSEAEDDEEG